MNDISINENKAYNENKLQETRISTLGCVDKCAVLVHDAILNTWQRSQRRKHNNKQWDKRKFPTNTMMFDTGNMTTKNAKWNSKNDTVYTEIIIKLYPVFSQRLGESGTG